MHSHSHTHTEIHTHTQTHTVCSQIDVYTHGFDISLNLCSQLPTKYWNDRDMPDSTLSRYHTHILSHNHYHEMCMGEGIGNRKSLEFTVTYHDWKIHTFYAVNFRHSDSITDLCRIQVHTGTPLIFCLTTTTTTRKFTRFMISTSSTVLQSLIYAGFKSTQVSHTYSVSQPLPWYVYSCRNRHPKTTRIYGCIPVLHHFYALKLRQSVAIIELSRIQVHTGTPHIFCLTTTTIICVFVKEYAPETHSNLRLYARTSPLLCFQ